MLSNISYRSLVAGGGRKALFLLVLFFMTGCGTSRRATTVIGTVGAEALSKGDFLRTYNQKAEPQVIDAKGYISALFDGKEVGVGARWSLKRDEEFVLSLRVFGLMEAGKLTVTQNNLTVIDRMGKRGLALDNLSETLSRELKAYNIDPRILTAMAHHRPFSNKVVGGSALKGMDFSIGSHEGLYRFEDKKHRIIHDFDNGLNLIRSFVTLPSGEMINIEYSDFVLISPQIRPYPKSMILTVIPTDVRKQAKVQIQLDNISTRFSQRVDTSIPDGYKRMTVDQLKDLIIDLDK